MPTEDYLQEHIDRGTDRIGLQVYPEPEGVTDAPVVVVWPAMGVRARYYRPLAAALREAGMAAVVADLREEAGHPVERDNAAQQAGGTHVRTVTQDDETESCQVPIG